MMYPYNVRCKWKCQAVGSSDPCNFQPHAQITVRHTWYQTIRANMFKLEMMRLLGSHLLLMVPKTTSNTANFSSHIYISMSRSFSALLQCFPCRNIATDGFRLHLHFMPKSSNGKSAIPLWNLFLQTTMFVLGRVMIDADTTGLQLCALIQRQGSSWWCAFCALYLNLFWYIYPILYPLQPLWAAVWSKFTVFLTYSQVWWMLAWTVGKKPKLLSDKGGMWILCL